MGVPKYKKNSSQKAQINESNEKELAIKYQGLIRNSLKNSDQIKKAALIIEIWMNSKPKKP